MRPTPWWSQVYSYPVLYIYVNDTEDESYQGRSGEGTANDSGENDHFDGFGGGAEERPRHD